MSKSRKNISKSNSLSFGSILMLFLFSGALVFIGLETLNRSYGGLGNVVKSYANTLAQSAYQWADLNVGERRVKSRFPGGNVESDQLDSRTLFKLGGANSGESRARFSVKGSEGEPSKWRSRLSGLTKQQPVDSPVQTKPSIEKLGNSDRLGLSKLIENL